MSLRNVFCVRNVKKWSTLCSDDLVLCCVVLCCVVLCCVVFCVFLKKCERVVHLVLRGLLSAENAV